MLKLILQALILMLVISVVPKQRLEQADVINATLFAVVGLLMLDFVYPIVFKSMRDRDPERYA
jgi:ABC-type polysaccharide/polyol phosphate export permease